MLCKRRKPTPYHSKQLQAYRNQSRQTSCWRNPFVVFCITFLAIGSLRFRVRTKRAAQTLLQKGKNTIFHRNAMAAATIEYKVVTEGTLSSSNAVRFQRYAASVTSKSDAAAASSTTTTTVSVGLWAELLALSKEEDSSLIGDFVDVLRKCPYEAFFFETKGVTIENAHSKVFEFVLVEAPRLQQFVKQKIEKSSKQSEFQEMLDCSDNPYACVFPNLSGDALLVAPKLLTDATTSSTLSSTTTTPPLSVYGHVAYFVRRAPAPQVLGFWRRVVEAYHARLQVAGTVAIAGVGRNTRSLLLFGNNNNNQTQETHAGKRRHEPVWLSTSGLGVAWLHARFDRRPKYYTFQPFAQEQ